MIESYKEARVALAPSGELVLALPIYANQTGHVFEEVPANKISIGLYEQFGYLIYHPKSDFSFYLKDLGLFQDLGGL